MGTLTVILWRDIPAQVVGRDGRRTSKIVLHGRFQIAIDKAASRAGKRAYSDYIEEWRKLQRPCGEELEAEVRAESDRLEAEFTRHRLAELIMSGGVAGGSALPPATDETPASSAESAPSAGSVPPDESAPSATAATSAEG